jgi:chromosome partitioning protein
MKVIAVVSQKGGCGKTTITTELAVASMRAGYRTLVLDMDPQASAGVWGDDRGGRPPQVVGVQPGRFQVFLDQAQGDGAEVVVIDTPPNAADVGLKAAKAADLVLVPSKQSPRDAAAIVTTVQGVADLAGKPSWVVMNEAKVRTSMSGIMIRALAQAGMRVCPVSLGDRIAFVNAISTGSTSLEYDGASPAAQEVEALWSWVCRQLRLPETRETAKPLLRKPAKPAMRAS